MVAAGAVAGLMPLAHAHSFAVLLGMAGCLALLFWRQWRLWAIFCAVAMAIAAPQLWWITRGSLMQSERFIGWAWGWDKGDQNFLWFWLMNTGLFIPLLLAALLWRGARPVVPRRLVLFALPCALCCIIPTVMRLAPWVWDNIKVMIYWYVASAPLVALLLARLWRAEAIFWRVAAVALLVSLILAGSLDLWRVAARTQDLRTFDADSIEFGELIRRETEPRALILHAPTYNHPVLLTGRRSLMGYPGHLWSHGFNYAAREADIKRIYAGGPDAEDLMKRYGVEYVMIGPTERGEMPLNERFFERYPLVGDTGVYRLYKITDR